MEEPAVEGNKSKAIIAVVIMLVIVFAAIGFYLVYGGANGITMNEGKIIADEIIESMNEEYLFTGAGGHEELRRGYFSDWGYHYYLFSSENIIVITVFQNGETTSKYNELDNETISNIIKFEVDTWELDSPDALDVSSSNGEISSFLRKYNTEINLMQITHPDMAWNSVVIDMPVWYISYQRITYLDDPKSAEIYIDANTGEVIYVIADS